MAEKHKSKLRKKLSDAAKRNESGGRSVGYKPLKGGHKAVSVPKRQRTAYFDQIKGKVVDASKKRAHEVLGGKLKGDVSDAYRGLTGIRHPSQLIPAIKKGGSLAAIIKSLTEK